MATPWAKDPTTDQSPATPWAKDPEARTGGPTEPKSVAGVAEQQTKPGFWSTLGSDISSIPHTVANVGRLSGIGQTPQSFSTAAHELADPNINLFHQGMSEMRNGQWLGGAVHAGEGLVPGLGPMTHGIADDVSAGNYGRAGARALELAGPEMIKAVAPVVSNAASAAAEGFRTPTPVGKAITSMIPVFGPKINALREAMRPGEIIPPEPPLISPSSATGGYSRPDYSGLIHAPGSDVPPYQSSITPEPGFRTGATASPANPFVPMPKPSVRVPWLDEPPASPSLAPVPHPSTYVATPSSGSLVEPWKPPSVAPSAQTSTNPGNVTFGKSYQTSTNSPITGGATTVTPGAIPEMMRQTRLNAATVSPSVPAQSPIIAPRGLTSASERLAGTDVAPAPVTPASADEVLQRAAPDYSEVTKKYQPSRTKARFDSNGKRTGG